MSNLKDNIKAEIDRGRLQDTFTPNQVKKLSPAGKYCRVDNTKYLQDSINHILANHSVGPGDRKGESVNKGGEILFVRVGRGTYALIEENVEEELTPGAPPNVPPENNEGEGRNTIAEKFVDYIRNKPFRILLNTRSGGKWYPDNGAVVGWLYRLNQYSWGGSDWQETRDRINGFVDRLGNLRDNRGANSVNDEKQAGEIYADIKQWGNPNGTERNGSAVFACLEQLWSSEITIVDSTLTKLYAFAEPDIYMIYDSRVATAIVSIAEDVFRYKTIDGKRIETVNINFCRQYSSLGSYPGSGGTRPRGVRWSGWPNAYTKVKAQLEANDLCRRMVNVLNNENEDGKNDWTIREVEAVLFMEGY